MKTKKETPRKTLAKEKIYHLHIGLDGTTPLVWREVLVPGTFTLEALHSVFQLVMGWQMSHLYDFEIAGARYSEPDEFDDIPTKPVTKSLAAAIGDEKSFAYNYDFGDGWRHIVEVKAILPRDEFNYPLCIGGGKACPPEDCGGLPGFEEFKEQIANTKDPEHRRMLIWVGGYFDPKSFDANRINRDMLWMIDWSRKPNDQGLYLPFNNHLDSELSGRLKS
jgi:hypothetical protein